MLVTDDADDDGLVTLEIFFFGAEDCFVTLAYDGLAWSAASF